MRGRREALEAKLGNVKLRNLLPIFVLHPQSEPHELVALRIRVLLRPTHCHKRLPCCQASSQCRPNQVSSTNVESDEHHQTTLPQSEHHERKEKFAGRRLRPRGGEGE